jgi:hypothetical protein
MKFCRDCKFARKSADVSIEAAYLCRRPLGIDPVTAQVNVNWRSCTRERAEPHYYSPQDDRCGPDAKYYVEATWRDFIPFRWFVG